MDATKPYKFMGIGAMDVTKPYKFTHFGATDVTKPYKFMPFKLHNKSTPGTKARKPQFSMTILVVGALPPSAAGPTNHHFPENVWFFALVPQASKKHLANKLLRDAIGFMMVLIRF